MQKQMENLISSINSNTKTINRLLIEKKKILCRLYTTLELKRHGKIALGEKQIDAFSRFMSYYENEEKNINEQFRLMCPEKSSEPKNGGRRIYGNYELFPKDLDSFSKWQANMLEKLTEVVEEGEGVLKKLESNVQA